MAVPLWSPFPTIAAGLHGRKTRVPNGGGSEGFNLCARVPHGGWKCPLWWRLVVRKQPRVVRSFQLGKNRAVVLYLFFSGFPFPSPSHHLYTVNGKDKSVPAGKHPLHHKDEITTPTELLAQSQKCNFLEFLRWPTCHGFLFLTGVHYRS